MISAVSPIVCAGARHLQCLVLVVAALLCALLLPAAADDRIEIFDAHLDYNWQSMSQLPPAAVLALLKQNNVTGIIATSRPSTGTYALSGSNANDLWVVPFIRPYRVRADIATWMNDPSVFNLVREEYRRGIYRGIGEFHLAGRAAATAEVKLIVDFAAEKNLYLHCHCDSEALELLFSHNPRSRIIWAHTGFALDIAKVRSLLATHTELWGELSYRSGITDSAGQLTAAWRELFEAHPDRFLLGSDTWTKERWTNYSNIMSGYRHWLAQLPPDVASKIAHENGKRLFAQRVTTQ